MFYKKFLVMFDAPDDVGGAGGAQPENPTNEDESNDNEDNDKAGKDEKTFTQAQVDEMINKRLAREKEAAEKAAAEAQKLAKMNADQKKQYELEQAQNEAKSAQEKLAKYEMRDEARNMLSEIGVSLTNQDLDLIVTPEAETTKANVNQLLDLVNRVKEDIRTDLLKGKTPKNAGNVIVNDDPFAAHLAKYQN